MGAEFKARVFRNGRSRAVRIPAGIDLPGDEVVFRQDENGVTLTPSVVRKMSLAELLDSWEPLPPGERFDEDVEDYPPEPVDW